MSDLVKSLGTLVSDMGQAARKEISESLRPALKKLGEALEELEAKLEAAVKSGAAGRKRRGRPVGSGKKKAAKKTARKGARRGAKRSPRGALQAAVREVLEKGRKPLKLSQIRDGVLKTATFKDREPKTLYTMIVFAVKKMPEVRKTAGGLYALEAKAATPKPKKK